MKNIELINASAGSGKTYNLTKRVTRILEEGMEPESVMVTTFTTKAAAELRERTRINLLQSKKSECAGRIYDGFIGTVNSICARILKEYAIEAGISPSVDTMAQEDSERIFKIAIDSVIDEYAKKMEAPAQRLGLSGESRGYGESSDWRKHVKEIVDYARANQITGEKLDECRKKSLESFRELLGEPDSKDYTDELKEKIDLAINHLEQIENLSKTTKKELDKVKDCKKNRDNLKWGDWVKLSNLKPAKDGADILHPLTVTAEKVISSKKMHEDIRNIIDGAFECASLALDKYRDYKLQHGLMDFTDQETVLLDLLRENKAFCESLKDRIKVLMVDEFQDTSPIQLALFLSLHEIAGHSVWVGDPKQAIYAFRGTDPQLMEQFVSVLDETQILKYSWRSKERLVDFTNQVFSKAFSSMGKEKVHLEIPAERSLEAKGGSVEVWKLNTKNNADDLAATANAVADLMLRRPEIKAGDIGILCRTNDECEKIAKALEKLGIRVSVGQGLLMDSRECQIATAALGFMNNENDSLSLTRLIKLTKMNDSGKSWIEELMESPEETKIRWKNLPVAKKLSEGREYIKYWTPLEALEEAISRSGVIRQSAAWENNTLVKSNLDKLRFSCREYIEQCRSQRSAATIEGFIAWIDSSKPSMAKGTGEDTVNILTYHGAKGLEWPWVVMSSLSKDSEPNIFGVNVVPAKVFDTENPLSGRTINYWPWPFDSQKNFAYFDEKTSGLEYAKNLRDKAKRESGRVLYVGMTRARDGLVFAARHKSGSLNTKWLDILESNENSGNPVISFDMTFGEEKIFAGGKEIPADFFEYDASCPEENISVSVKDQYLPVVPEEIKRHFPARLSPSTLENNPEFLSVCSEIKWKTLVNFEKRIHIPGNSDIQILGNAIHGYLATAYEEMEEHEKLKTATEILKGWKIKEEVIKPGDIVEAGKMLEEFIKSSYPGCKIYKEWPMTYKTIHNQNMQGWIDMLIQTPEGYIILDHKSYPGSDTETWAKKHAPQLQAYREAVEKATGIKVTDTLLHLPVNGIVLNIDV